MPITLKKTTDAANVTAWQQTDYDANMTAIENAVNANMTAIDTLNANASLQQAGSITLQLTSGAGSGTVTFPTEYPTTPPYIVLTPVVGTLGNKLVYGIKNVTKTGFDIVCERDSGYTAVMFYWISVPR